MRKREKIEMGLDITAYQRLVLMEEDDSDEIAVSRGDIEDTETMWPGRTAGLPRADLKLADGAGDLEFRAGSYSGYGDWRSELCLLAHGIPATEFWRQERKEGAFFELIHFSDCEGILGPVACRKLAQDFADYQDQANDRGNVWFTERYAQWRKACEFAGESGTGAIWFH
jgi:hypothetical protein